MATLDLRELYLSLVCLVTLILLIVGSVQSVRHGVELLLPDPPPILGPAPVASDTTHALPATRTPLLYEQAWQQTEQLRMRRRALRGLLINLVLVLLAGLIYRTHWRRLQATRRT
ncbi:hypothetical protein [Rhodothermus profundi]|uniref:Uncharacterized protein n=1 Tax=Rhodothermus profundi TaxID=633813 RepID=A0A1M6RSJ8_9BACT|nr:hypothetical protein [Rhodothermus profundi]SHK35247.1 hypothetical protein SAMN04488087_0944 [Rhodothermus profundi]